MSPAARKLLLNSTTGLLGATLFCGFMRDRYFLNGTIYNSFLAIPGATYTGGAPGGSCVQQADGSLKLVAQNVPRRSDLGLLVEEARTQLIVNSVLAGIVAGAPTGWGANLGGGAGVASLYGADSAAMTFTAAASRQFISQVVNVAAATTYVCSALVEANPGGLQLQELIAIVGQPAGATVAYSAGATSVPAAGTWITCTLTVAATAGTGQFRIGAGVSSNQTASATLSRPQVEAGAFRTSHIPNASTVATTTRAADVVAISGINLASPFSVLAQGLVPPVAAALSTYFPRVLGDTASGVSVLGFEPSGAADSYDGTVNLLTANTLLPGAAYKTAMSQQAGLRQVVSNGGNVVSNASALLAVATIKIGDDNGTNYLNSYLSRLTVYSTAYSAAQLQALTTP